MDKKVLKKLTCTDKHFTKSLQKAKKKKISRHEGLQNSKTFIFDKKQVLTEAEHPGFVVVNHGY